MTFGNYLQKTNRLYNTQHIRNIHWMFIDLCVCVYNLHVVWSIVYRELIQWCVQILAKKEKETFSQPTDVAR
jgi:hypothetical protein